MHEAPCSLDPLIGLCCDMQMLRQNRPCSACLAAQHSPAQPSPAQPSPAQHSTAQHSTAQHSTAQHSTAQHSTAQHGAASTLCVQHLLTQQTTSACSQKDPLRRNSTRGEAKHACASSTLSLRLLSCSGVKLRNLPLAAYSAVRPAIALSSLDPLSFPDACASKVPIAHNHDFSTRVSLKLLWGSHDFSTIVRLELPTSNPGVTGIPRQKQSAA
jgi:hypothetical protein